MPDDQLAPIPECAHAPKTHACCRTLLAGDKLLPAVDVIGRAGKGRIGHDVYGQRRHIGWFDDAPDGKGCAKLIAAMFELIAEE